jgi:hypothetical protein
MANAAQRRIWPLGFWARAKTKIPFRLPIKVGVNVKQEPRPQHPMQAVLEPELYS